ncbi:MAG TPA: hypothetical protein PK177_20375, partial [Burkholderiaceae bacterium]|nr:hypothetical protein [Burkholderiaceae bacterium]
MHRDRLRLVDDEDRVVFIEHRQAFAERGTRSLHLFGTGGSGQSAGADGNLTIESSGATGDASVTVRDGGSIFVGGLPGGGTLAIR